MTAADIPIAVSGARIAERFRLDDRIHDTVPAGSTQGSQLWRATDEILARAVIIRILPPGFARTGEILAAARAASRLSDPRLARIFDACDGDDGAYIITEWPPGDHLADLLAAGPLSGARAVTLIAEAAGALAAAHAAGVSHLCLTPRSLLWNPTTGTKIIGLGVDAALAGVPADDQGLADARGLASLLYAALTAHWPGQNGHTLPPAPQRTGQTYPPRQVRADVPRHLDLVVRRALFGQTRHGHPPIFTPAQMASALSTGTQARVTRADGVTSAAAPAKLSGRAIRTAGRHPRSPAAAGRPPRRQPAGSPLLLGAAAGLATIILGAGLWAVYGRSGHMTCVPSPVSVQERPVVAVQERLVVAVGALTPADVRSFDPYGAGEGHAILAADHNPDTTWRSQWYTTARFGNLKPGTGLMVDMGSQVTFTRTMITFGATPGADVQLRVGDSADSLSSLKIVARVSPAVGVTDIPVTPPAVGRYLLIWFTRLPPKDDGSGKFQATVREVTPHGTTVAFPPPAVLGGLDEDAPAGQGTVRRVC